MGNVAKKITQIGPSEQDFEQKEPSEPWLRQKGEPAKLYLWFKRYLDLGPKRSLRKALADEPSAQKATKGDKNQAESKKGLSNVSIPGSWSRASKVWNWVERAKAYDLHQVEKQAIRIREMATTVPHASKAYRILQLDYLARLLKDQIKQGLELKWCLAITARYQSIMQQIAREMEGLDGATLDACDAAALDVIKQEMAKSK
jgi:hypothetical protein